MRLAGMMVAGLLAVLPGPALAQPAAQDPLRSVMWETVRYVLFGDAPVVFDDARVQVFTPVQVEDNMQVPVSVRVEGLDDVREIVVFADLNPIPEALTYHPVQAAPAIELSIKINEATAIRAAARTGDGVWHVGGMVVDAPGGGCTVASPTQASMAWEDHLNEVQGRAWRLPDGGVRLRWRIVHPMDTGLVDNIPTFYIESLTVATAAGQTLARLEPREPVAENPVFTIDLGPAAAGQDLILTGRDTDGNPIQARIPRAETPFGLASLAPPAGQARTASR